MTAVIGLSHGLLGRDSCQGFYFARPMSSSSLDALIQRPANGNPRLPAIATTTKA